MPTRFGRDYQLAVLNTTPNDTDANATVDISISPPITMEFLIRRHSLASLNEATLVLTNLNEDNREFLRKDTFDYNTSRTVFFRVGYEENISQAFIGNIKKGQSVRRGTEWVTTLDCFDAGYAYSNARINRSFPAGSSQKEILLSMLESLTLNTQRRANRAGAIKVGAVGNYTGNITRGNSYSGYVMDILKEISGGGFFIDNQVAHILKDREYIRGVVLDINADTGLLDSPEREFQFVKFKMLFEPRIHCGNIINITSRSPSFNGIHKVTSVSHTGLVSESVGGNAYTIVECYPGDFTPVDIGG